MAGCAKGCCSPAQRGLSAKNLSVARCCGRAVGKRCCLRACKEGNGDNVSDEAFPEERDRDGQVFTRLLSEIP